jgi:hypothetical protein
MSARSLFTAAAATLLTGTIAAVGLTACSGTGEKPISTIEAQAATATQDAKPEFVLPAPSDFALEIVELERSCFGSAGCNVTYTLRGSYIGTAAIPDNEEFRVLFKVTGADDPKTGYIEYRNGDLYGDDQEFVSASSGSVLKAVPTDVIR